MKQYTLKTIACAMMGVMAATPALAQPNNTQQRQVQPISVQPKTINAAQPGYAGQLQGRTETTPSRNRTAAAPVQPRSGAAASGTRRVNPVGANSNQDSDLAANDGHKRCTMVDNTTGKTDVNRACVAAMRDSEGAGSRTAAGSQQGLSERQKGLLMLAGGAAVLGGTAYYLDRREKRRERNSQQTQTATPAAPAAPAAAQHQQANAAQAAAYRTIRGNASRPNTTIKPSAPTAAQNQQAASQPINIEQELRQSVTRPGTSLGNRNHIGSNAQTFNGQPPRARVIPAAAADPVRDNQAKPIVRPAFGN